MKKFLNYLAWTVVFLGGGAVVICALLAIYYITEARVVGGVLATLSIVLWAITRVNGDLP